MRRPSRSGLSLVIALSAVLPLAAQNLESIGKAKPFSFAGGLSINQTFYASSGAASRRDPYSYHASANVNLSIYGWTMPLTFNVSNQNTSFSQPFNQYSLHPTYRWITAHAGYTSMSFSPYTVNGHIFLGGGIDLEPDGKWKFSGFYGRLLKAVEPDSSKTSPSCTFQRMGYGLKVTYASGRNSVDVILFHAQDDPNSVKHLPDSLDVTPQQNLVLGLGAGTAVLKHFLLKTELATSAMSKDTQARKTVHDHPLARSGLFQPRLSSYYYHAFKTSFDYQREEWIIGFAYERIDPEYRTLGAYYFNNDLENVTLNASTALHGKLNMATSAGIQRDNLQKTKISTMKRMVCSFNATYAASLNANLSGSYSSFRTHTNIRSQFESINQLTPYDNLDTLNFMQVSRNGSLSGMYFTTRGNKKQSFQLQATWQEAGEKQGDQDKHAPAHFYNIHTGYSINLLQHNMCLAINFNTTINQHKNIRTRLLGPSVTISRSFFKRALKTMLSTSYNTIRSDGVKVSTVINSRFTGAISLHEKHNMNLSVVVLNRKNKIADMRNSISEFTGTAGYSYTLGRRRVEKHTVARE